jgi:7-cyano-7-deazaguanine synthase
VTGLFAVLVDADDGGIRIDIERIVRNSSARGADGYYVAPLRPDFDVEIIKMDRPNNLSQLTKLAHSYQLIGCAFSRSATSTDEPIAISEDGRWIVVIDGVVAGVTTKEIANYLSVHGWLGPESYTGQFALLAINKDAPTKLYFATRAKPLFILKDTLQRYVAVASQSAYFTGLYHPILTSSPVEVKPNTYGYITQYGQYVQDSMLVESGRGTLVLSGGGLDTLVAAYAERQANTTFLYVNYDQRASEREYAATCAIAKSLSAVVVALPSGILNVVRTPLVPGGETVSHSPVGGVASEWVPGRNSLLMAMALSFAESNEMARIVTGINMEAASAYPDNEMEWLNKWRALVPYSVNTGRSIELSAPLAGMNKTDIVKLGKRLDVPFKLSWSCYENGGIIDAMSGNPRHCGTCSSCRARRGAFKAARIKDPTEYTI